MAYKSSRVLQTVIIPTDLLSPLLLGRQTMRREGVERQEGMDRGNHRVRKCWSKIARQRLGETALEGVREGVIWTKRPHISLPRDVIKAHCAAMMHMIHWRGLCSNHRGLAGLARGYLNPSSPASSWALCWLLQGMYLGKQSMVSGGFKKHF